MPRYTSENFENFNATNPSILDSTPRPGGFINTDSKRCTCSKKKSSHISIRSGRSRSSRLEVSSREVRISQGIAEFDWTTTATEEQHASIGIYNPLNDSIEMLSVVISAVMLMASDSKIPCIHLEWTKKYLTCIRDEYGNHPPNVQGILNYIRYLYGETEEKKSSSCGSMLSCGKQSQGSKESSRGSACSQGSNKGSGSNTVVRTKITIKRK